MENVYRQLVHNPPKLKFPTKTQTKNKVKEVVFDLCSCMCDNRYRFTFKKSEAGEFRLLTHGYSFSNYQIKGCYMQDLEWLADDGDWCEIIEYINSGVQVVEKVKYR